MTTDMTEGNTHTHTYVMCENVCKSNGTSIKMGLLLRLEYNILFSVFTRFAIGKVRFCVLTQLDVPRVSLPAAKYNLAA